MGLSANVGSSRGGGFVRHPSELNMAPLVCATDTVAASMQYELFAVTVHMWGARAAVGIIACAGARWVSLVHLGATASLCTQNHYGGLHGGHCADSPRISSDSDVGWAVRGDVSHDCALRSRFPPAFC